MKIVSYLTLIGFFILILGCAPGTFNQILDNVLYKMLEKEPITEPEPDLVCPYQMPDEIPAPFKPMDKLEQEKLRKKLDNPPNGWKAA